MEKKLTPSRNAMADLCRLFKAACLITASASLFTSCIKDDFDLEKIKDVEWSPELAAPLVNSSMTFKDMLDKNTEFQVTIDNNNFCTFIYSDTLYKLHALDMITMKDQDVKYTFAMDSSQQVIFNQVGDLSYSESQHISFKPDVNAEIDSILFKSGRFIVDITSTFRQDISIRITMPGLKKNGVAFSRNVLLSYQGSLPLTNQINLDLSGYLLDVTNNGTAVNDLTVDYKIQVTGSVNPASATENLVVDGTFQNLKFRSVFGYFGNQPYSSASDTLPFNFFNTHPGIGNFTLADPKIKVSLINSIGIPVHATIPSFMASSQGASYTINSGIPNPLPVFSPTVSQIGQSLTGSFELNNSNSNLVSVISHLPDYFIYMVGVQTNPDGNISQNFITDTSSLSIYASVELPLYGSAMDFVITDTTDFKIDNIDRIESLALRTCFTNGFPVDMQVQVYFTDENFHVLDSLITNDSRVLESAAINMATGKTTAATVKTTDILFDQQHIQRIQHAKKIITKGGAATINNGNTNVKIYADYTLGVRIGARAKIKVTQ
jgi:hypothetical protein